MKIQPNAVDLAIREWLRLDDNRFAFYMENREQIQDLLRKRRAMLDSDDELKEIINNQIDRMMKSKKRNSIKILECQAYLHYQSGDAESLKKVEIGKLAGTTGEFIGMCVSSGIQKMRQHPLLKEGGELNGYFNKENKRWL